MYRPNSTALLNKQELSFLTENKDFFTEKTLGIVSPREFKPRKRLNKYISEIPDDILGETRINENLLVKYKCKVASKNEEKLEIYLNFNLVSNKETN